MEMNRRERMVRVARIVSELSGAVPPGEIHRPPGGALFLCFESTALANNECVCAGSSERKHATIETNLHL